APMFPWSRGNMKSRGICDSPSAAWAQYLAAMRTSSACKENPAESFNAASPAACCAVSHVDKASSSLALRQPICPKFCDISLAKHGNLGPCEVMRRLKIRKEHNIDIGFGGWAPTATVLGSSPFFYPRGGHTRRAFF